ncbi:CDP-glycerol glycerophosphotransferase family protein [Fibrobacter sp.]|uniref:CDP-glycerol glycerophosphotransferase family protein n=1 Tax=Fibrobacter sp. TaxID=35828 RepID=UPI003890A019
MLKRIFLNLLSLVFHFVPRDKHLWVTGKTTSWDYVNAPPAFFDNSKYFFLYIVNNTTEKVYWLTSSKNELEMLRKMDLPVVKYPSIKGVILVLRAKFSFHHYGPNQIDPILQQGSIQLDFWHGTPLKKIRYDVVKKPIQNRNRHFEIMNKNGIEYVFSTSRFLSQKILGRAFAVSQDKLINFGYPRMDIMRLTTKENIEFCKRYSPELLKYIGIAQKYKKVFLYMPTFRDDDPDYFKKANIDFDQMNKELKKINGVFFLKLHPLTRHSQIEEYDNIVQINNDTDIYPFLNHTDILITDYSSIYFDYLVLDKEIIFIPFDYKNYTHHRELYFNYNEITPGVKYNSFSDFIKVISKIDKLNYSNDRKKVRDLLIENYNFDACEKIFKFIKSNHQ